MELCGIATFLIPKLIQFCTLPKVNIVTDMVIITAAITFLGFNLSADPFLTLLKKAPITTTIKYLQFRPMTCAK